MKKNIRIVLPILLIIYFSVITPKLRADEIDDLLSPYQIVIDKVNSDLGSTISIPESGKEEVYNNIKNMPPDELEKLLRKEYAEFLSQDYNTKENDGNHKYSPESQYYNFDNVAKSSEYIFIPNSDDGVHFFLNKKNKGVDL